MRISTFVFNLFIICSTILYGQDGTINLSENTDGNWDVGYTSNVDVGGFQFDVDGATVLGASGGDAATAGLTVSTGNTTVLGFSLTGGSMPAGSGILTVLELDGVPTGLSGITFSSPLGSQLDFAFDDGSGCTDSTACNYDADAVSDDGSCLYDDCAGECGGSAVVDDCGVCDGNNASQDCAGVCDGSAVEDCISEEQTSDIQ